MSVIDLPGQADALHRLEDVIHAHPGLPPVEIEVRPDAVVELHAYVRAGDARWKVDAWAHALGVHAHAEPGGYQASALLGSHTVTVWTAGGAR